MILLMMKIDEVSRRLEYMTLPRLLRSFAFLRGSPVPLPRVVLLHGGANGLLPSFLKHGRCLLPSFRQLRQWGHLPLLWSLSLLDLLSIPSCGMSPLPLLWSLSLLLIVLCKLFGHKDRCILMAFRSAWRAIFLYVCASISPDACGLIPHQPQLARREAASAS